MVAIELRFTAGRFHATPWGRHVNEGAPEWPPSPWRLLRALVATWHRKCPSIPEPTVRGLLHALADGPPVFHLPPASAGHTRHYLRGDKPGESAMVFDAFIRLAPDVPVVVCWPDLDLRPEHHDALQALLGGLGYFGRSESWADAGLNDRWGGEPNCRPCLDEGDEGGDSVPVLVPQPAAAYASWREEAFPAAVEAATERKRAASKSAKPVELTRPQLAQLEATYPRDLLTALHAETTDLRKQGWMGPPGAERVPYRLPPEALRSRPRPPAPPVAFRPTVARFALAGPVLPLLTECIYVAETMRQALMKWSDGAQVFAGKDIHGRPLAGHGHAFVLPADDDGDGRLDHIIVYCREGFDEGAQQALASIRRLWQASGRPDLYLALIGLGEARNYGGHDVRAGHTPLLASSRLWVSRTPLLLTRHPKLRKNGSPRLGPDGQWRDGPVQQVCAALEGLRHPVPRSVAETHETEAAGRPVRWLDFARERRRGDGPPVTPRGWGFELRFDEEVTGPLALGYASHFGLGQFVAVADGA